MSTREQAVRLANSDWRAAVGRARAVTDPWYRCQALAWAARFAPDEELVRIADEAIKTATAGKDAYQKVAAVAWPVRALIERGNLARAGKAVNGVLARVPEFQYADAQAEALFLLLQAALPAPHTVWKPVFEAIFNMPHPPIHWRQRRVMRDAILMVHARDPALADVARGRVKDDKTRRQVDRRLAASERVEPRSFFHSTG